MTLSLLSHLFQVERHRLKASDVGHSAPVLVEMGADPSVTPLLVSNMRGNFLPSRVSKSGVLRYAFSSCPLEKEDEWFSSLARTVRLNWGSCKTLEEALAKMEAQGRTPKCVVSSSKVEVPDGCGLVITPEPNFVLVAQDAGLYVRIGEFAGVVVYRADSSLVVIDG